MFKYEKNTLSSRDYMFKLNKMFQNSSFLVIRILSESNFLAKLLTCYLSMISSSSGDFITATVVNELVSV